ncbi:MAG TPA: Ig-like domain-containing protein [Fimbriimonas sp.]
MVDVTELLGQSGTRPIEFARGGALVGLYHFVWFEEDPYPRFIYLNGTARTIDFGQGAIDIAGVTATGEAAGTWSDYETFASNAFLSTSGGTRLLGKAGKAQSEAVGLSEAGMVAGSVFDDSERTAVVWPAGQPDQPTVLMPSPSWAIDIDESGTVLLQGPATVGAFTRTHPYLWRRGRLIDLAENLDLSSFPSATPPDVFVQRIGDSTGLVFTVAGKTLAGEPVHRVVTRVWQNYRQATPDLVGDTFAVLSVPLSGDVLFRFEGRPYLSRKNGILDLFARAGVSDGYHAASVEAQSNGGVVVFRHPRPGTESAPVDELKALGTDGRLYRLDVGREGRIERITSRGEVFGTYTDAVELYWFEQGHAFRWHEGKLTFLNVPSANNTWTWASNDSGDSIGTYDTNRGKRAFLLRRGQVRDLGISAQSLGEYRFRIPYLVSPDGRFTANTSDGRTLLITEDPLAVPDAYSVVANQARTADPDEGVLANDQGDRLAASLSSPPSHGVVDLRLDGSFRYEPAPGYTGADSFQYHISRDGTVYGSATVSLEVVSVNAAPVVTDGLDRVIEPTWFSAPNQIAVIVASASDENDPPHALRYEWTKGGKPVCEGPKLVAGLPLGDHTFTVTVRDPHGGTASRNVTVSVVDRTPPVIWGEFEPIQKTATSSAGSIVEYEPFYAYDEIDGEVPARCSRASGTLFPLGKSTLRIVAQDRAGNRAVEQVPVHIAYQGVVSVSSSSVQAGAPIEARFSMSDASFGIADASGKLWVKKVGANQTAVDAGALAYDAGDQRYERVWNTEGLSPGTYTLRFDMGDGVHRSVQVEVAP